MCYFHTRILILWLLCVPLPGIGQYANSAVLTPSVKVTLMTVVGSEPNGLPVPTNAFKADEIMMCGFEARSTGATSVAFFKNHGLCSFELRHANGESVPLTTLGKKRKKDLDIELASIKPQIKSHIILPGAVRYEVLFKPEDYFIIPKQGRYTLSLRFHLWGETNKGQFGAFESDPLRVYVVKK